MPLLLILFAMVIPGNECECVCNNTLYICRCRLLGFVLSLGSFALMNISLVRGLIRLSVIHIPQETVYTFIHIFLSCYYNWILLHVKSKKKKKIIPFFYRITNFILFILFYFIKRNVKKNYPQFYWKKKYYFII